MSSAVEKYCEVVEPHSKLLAAHCRKVGSDYATEEDAVRAMSEKVLLPIDAGWLADRAAKAALGKRDDVEPKPAAKKKTAKKKAGSKVKADG